MAIKKKITRRKSVARPVHIGDLVQVTFGAQSMEGRVVEDRGAIGFGGRKLYRITLQTAGEEDPMSIELPVEEIVVTRRAATPKKVVRSKARKVKALGTQSRKKREPTIS